MSQDSVLLCPFFGIASAHNNTSAGLDFRSAYMFHRGSFTSPGPSDLQLATNTSWDFARASSDERQLRLPVISKVEIFSRQTGAKGACRVLWYVHGQLCPAGRASRGASGLCGCIFNAGRGRTFSNTSQARCEKLSIISISLITFHPRHKSQNTTPCITHNPHPSWLHVHCTLSHVKQNR